MFTNYLKYTFLTLLAAVSFTVFSQNVAINSTGNAGNAAAILDLSANTTLGFSLPNVSIGAFNSASPVTAPPDGLIVYNTNAAMTGGFGKGLYYWSAAASQWYFVENSGSGNGNYILNQTSQQVSANFNIKSAASSSIGGIIAANGTPSVDIFDIDNSAGTPQVYVNNTFDLYAIQGLNAYGAAVNLNASSNFVTNINTGTSTGAVNIANGASSTGTVGIANGGVNNTSNINIGGGTANNQAINILSGTSANGIVNICVGTPGGTPNQGVDINWGVNEPAYINCGNSGKVYIAATGSATGNVHIADAANTNGNVTIGDVASSGAQTATIAAAGGVNINVGTGGAAPTNIGTGTNTGIVDIGNSTGLTGINNATPASTLDDNGSLGTGIITVSGSITLSNTTNTVLAATGTYTITLPAVAAATRRIYNIVCNSVSGSGIITIQGNGSDNIYYEGVGANTLAISGGSVTLQSNGGNWYVIAGTPVLAHGTIKFNFTGALQYWTVPAGVTQVTVTAAGGAGGGCGATPTSIAAAGGTGAVFTASSWAVTAGHTLYIVVGGEGNQGAGYQGGSGGGGTYVWDMNNISTSVNIVAGGGGGAAYTTASLTATAGGNAAQTNFNTTPSGGAGGGAQSNEGSCGGGSGWNINGAIGENGSAGGFTSGQGGGFSTNGTSWGGAAGTTSAASQYYIEGVTGAYGGGGGTGDLVTGNYVGGGGGGGWNGGNGGHSGNSGPPTIGLGASSAINGATVTPTGGNTGNGYVTITY